MSNSERPWTVYRTRFLVHARQLTEPLVFTDALGREHSGHSGDYLVESCEGLRCITPRAAFEDIYVPFHPSPSDASRVKAPSADPAARLFAPQTPPQRHPAPAWSG
jgi:hypothetical protein